MTANRFDSYFNAEHGRTGQTSADRDVDRLQAWLDAHRLQSIKVQENGHKLVERIRERDVGRYTKRIVNVLEGAAISIGRALFDAILILVVSVYMLLGMSRFAGFVDRHLPPHGERPLVSRIEHALVAYVRGQCFLSLIIGGSAGIGLYVLGFLHLLPNGQTYAQGYQVVEYPHTTRRHVLVEPTIAVVSPGPATNETPRITGSSTPG